LVLPLRRQLQQMMLILVRVQKENSSHEDRQRQHEVWAMGMVNHAKLKELGLEKAMEMGSLSDE
jgi:hypothetical protein